MTVPTDDSAGGDTDGDGGAAAPQASGRGGLRVRASGAATLTSTEVRYQGVSAVGGSLIVQAGSVLHAPADGIQITESGTATVTNSLLIKDSPNASTVFASGSGSRVSLVNNTLVGGTNGVLIDETARLEKLVNNVIAFHTEAGVALVHAGTASPDVRANDVFNPTASLANYVNMQDYTGLLGNISADPKFVNRTAGDYQLGDGSPAVDAALEMARLRPISPVILASTTGAYPTPASASHPTRISAATNAPPIPHRPSI